ncbi:Hypothetical predicted protein [Xyrichtys novacula]|uniref:Uncharacterized protein n=1 Tax=Xyrichtys novacula TaxID=13765 RepID=A0AAV1GSQ5_XYRNO|nr:Hypothetical predicted protein [Xyrichtys novacula]
MLPPLVDTFAVVTEDRKCCSYGSSTSDPVTFQDHVVAFSAMLSSFTMQMNHQASCYHPTSLTPQNQNINFLEGRNQRNGSINMKLVAFSKCERRTPAPPPNMPICTFTFCQ